MIYKYVRDRHGNRVGVVVAFMSHKQGVKIGWSLCSPIDYFDKDIGINIARRRAESTNLFDVPPSIEDDVCKMIDRAGRYFKQPVEISVYTAVTENDWVSF